MKLRLAMAGPAVLALPSKFSFDALANKKGRRVRRPLALNCRDGTARELRDFEAFAIFPREVLAQRLVLEGLCLRIEFD